MGKVQYLKKGQIISFDEKLKLSVVSGKIWMTWEQDQEDHVLCPQEYVMKKKNGRMVIEGLENSSLYIADYSIQDEPELKSRAHAGIRADDESTDRSTFSAARAVSTRGTTDQEQF